MPGEDGSMTNSYLGIDVTNYNQRAQQRLAQEYAELDDPIVKAQLQLDYFWQRQLDERAARLRRIERPGAEDAGSGVYDPFQRFAGGTVGWGKI